MLHVTPSKSERFLEREIARRLARFNYQLKLHAFLYRAFCLQQVVPLLINILRGLPLIVVPAIYYRGDNGATSIEAGVITFFVIHLILALIGSFADTGTENPKWWQKIAV